MAFTTLTVRQDVAKRLRASKGVGESYSDVLNRLLDSQPAKSVGEWLDSLQPLEGRSLFSPAERARLNEDQLYPRESNARRRRHVAA